MHIFHVRLPGIAVSMSYRLMLEMRNHESVHKTSDRILVYDAIPR